MKRRLLWELRYRRDEFSIESGRAKGRPDPEWFLDCPELLPGEEVYLEAFWTLRSEAVSSMNSVARIPWSACMRYGAFELGWNEHILLRMFWRIIASMDSGYLEWMKNEHDRYVRMNKPKKPTSRNKTRQTYAR